MYARTIFIEICPSRSLNASRLALRLPVPDPVSMSELAMMHQLSGYPLTGISRPNFNL